MTPLKPVIDHWGIVPQERAMSVSGLQFNNSWKYEVEDVAVLQGPGTEDAANSASSLGFNVTIFHSFNLKEVSPNLYKDIDIKNILVPEHYQHFDWLQRIRIMNHRLDYGDVTRILNHMVAWYHCTIKGSPLIILESDARMRLSLKFHLPRSSIIGLDTKGELYQYNDNYRVMPGVWAYSVDQFSSKRLFDYVMSQGMREPLESMFRADQRLIILEDHAYKE